MSAETKRRRAEVQCQCEQWMGRGSPHSVPAGHCEESSAAKCPAGSRRVALWARVFFVVRVPAPRWTAIGPFSAGNQAASRRNRVTRRRRSCRRHHPTQEKAVVSIAPLPKLYPQSPTKCSGATWLQSHHSNHRDPRVVIGETRSRLESIESRTKGPAVSTARTRVSWPKSRP